MPVSIHGQLYTFSAVIDPDFKYAAYEHLTIHRGDTVRKIMAKVGHLDAIPQVLSLNRGLIIRHATKTPKRPNAYLRHENQKLLPSTADAKTKLRVPGHIVVHTNGFSSTFQVLAGDEEGPIVKEGYAQYEDVTRPGRLAINRFSGYKPIAISLEVQFEEFYNGDAQGVEKAIDVLERMAGRGNYAGAADGAPAVVSVGATDGNGNKVALFGENYQWDPKRNPTAPLWRISDIAWHGKDVRNDRGERLRALATITLRQYTPLVLAKSVSAAQRAKSKAKAKPPHKKKKKK